MGQTIITVIFYIPYMAVAIYPCTAGSHYMVINPCIKVILSIFVILNSKTQMSYEIIFNEIYRIISLNNNSSLTLQLYTVDYEISLENALIHLLQML